MKSVLVVAMMLLASCSAVPRSSIAAATAEARHYSAAEFEIRMLIYADAITEQSERIWFIDEDDQFIEKLLLRKPQDKIASSRFCDVDGEGRPFDVRTKKRGYLLGIEFFSISADSATAGISWHASSQGSEAYVWHFTLKDGRWLISERRLGGAS